MRYSTYLAGLARSARNLAILSSNSERSGPSETHSISGGGGVPERRLHARVRVGVCGETDSVADGGREQHREAHPRHLRLDAGNS